MKRFFEVFFIVLGVIFFIIILIAIYFFITDPLNLKPLIFDQDKQEVKSDTNSENSVEKNLTEDKNPNLTPLQEKALKSVGIEPESIPSSFTPEQTACFENKIGKERVEAIKAGDSPTPAEFYKAKGCL